MFNEAERNQLIIEWEQSQYELAEAKKKEQALRKKLLKVCFSFENDDREGTQNHDLGNGYKLKAGFKLNRKLDNKDNKIEDILERIEKSGNEGEFISDRLVKWKPELNLIEYRNLPELFRKIIDEGITTVPGTPSLELVKPK